MPTLTELEAIDRIEVVGVEFPMVQVRKADIIYRDGVEIASSFHRHVLAPGDDISGEDPKVQAVCEAVWTDEIVAAYLAHLEAQKPAPEPEPEEVEEPEVVEPETETEEPTDV
jgi:hypothetical protein